MEMTPASLHFSCSSSTLKLIYNYRLYIYISFMCFAFIYVKQNKAFTYRWSWETWLSLETLKI